MKKYIAINRKYGGFPEEYQREFDSLEDFIAYYKDKPIDSGFGECYPVAFEVELADDETYAIDEYDGLETIRFVKKEATTSQVIEQYDPDGKVFEYDIYY